MTKFCETNGCKSTTMGLWWEMLSYLNIYCLSACAIYKGYFFLFAWWYYADVCAIHRSQHTWKPAHIWKFLGSLLTWMAAMTICIVYLNSHCSKRWWLYEQHHCLKNAFGSMDINVLILSSLQDIGKFICISYIIMSLISFLESELVQTD